MNNHMIGGGDYTIFRGPPIQRGYGLGGSFRRFFKWIVPLVKQHTIPAIQSGLRDIGNTALSSAGDFAKDLAQGRDLKEAANHHMTTAVSTIRDQVEKKLKGGKRKRRKHKIIIKRHKPEYNDIFN